MNLSEWIDSKCEFRPTNREYLFALADRRSAFAMLASNQYSPASSLVDANHYASIAVCEITGRSFDQETRAER